MKLWGVVVVGLLLGLVGGLIVTWFVAPLAYYDTYPPMMDATYRQDWARMSAWSYALEGDWRRTETRLMNLPPAEVRAAATDVLQQAVADGRSTTILQRLAELAAAYGASSPAIAIYAEGGVPPADSDLVLTAESTPSPSTPTSAPTTLPTVTLRPTLTPTMTPSVPITEAVPIRVISQTLTCDEVPVIAVSLTLSRTVEERGREVQELVEQPMREVWLIWNEGADRAITGFRPERGLGYADFEVTPGRSYNLYVDSPSGIPIRTFQVEPCPPAEGDGWISRYLILQEEPPAEPEIDLTVTPTLTATLGLTPTLGATPTLTATGQVSPTATATAP